MQLFDQTTQPEAARNTTLREAGDDPEANPAERTCLAPATGLLGEADHNTAAAMKKVCIPVQIQPQKIIPKHLLCGRNPRLRSILEIVN